MSNNNTQQQSSHPVTSNTINNRKKVMSQILDKINTAQSTVHNTVRAASSVRRGGLTINKTTGIIIWMIGAWLTIQFLKQLGVVEAYATVVGIGLQLALTRAETPLWRGEGIPKMALGAVIVDIAINSSGAWPYAKNIGKTDFWTMVREVAESSTLDPSIATILSMSIGVGAFTAAAAEYFWNLD